MFDFINSVTNGNLELKNYLICLAAALACGIITAIAATLKVWNVIPPCSPTVMCILSTSAQSSTTASKTLPCCKGLKRPLFTNSDNTDVHEDDSLSTDISVICVIPMRCKKRRVSSGRSLNRSSAPKASSCSDTVSSALCALTDIDKRLKHTTSHIHIFTRTPPRRESVP